jgi:hypothetical protein
MEALETAHIISGAPQNPMSFEQLTMDMPVTSIDSLLLGVSRFPNSNKTGLFNEALSGFPEVRSEEEKLAYSVINEKGNGRSDG